MKKMSYPVLSKEYSVSKVITEKGDDIVLYNTATAAKVCLDNAEYEFLKRCRGDNPLGEIMCELSRVSGESPQEIEKNLSPVYESMVDSKILYFSPSPLHPPRPELCEPHLFARLQSVTFEVTHKCNLSCKHCYSNSGKKRYDELTMGEMRKLIDELANIGVFNIVLSGGEPLLHPRIFDIIECIRSKPMSCIVFTNGTLITEEVVQKFKEYSVLSVAISIDGARAETHDSFRGVKGSFDKTVQAIKSLRKVDIPVKAVISIHRDNRGELAELIDNLKEWGVDDYVIRPVSYTGRPQKFNCLITPEEYRECMEQLKECKTGKHGKELPSSDLMNCGIGMSSLTIRSDGSVAPCPPFPEEITLGNVIVDYVNDVWNNSPFLREVRHINAAENEKCRKCSYINVCRGGCLADIYMRTGELMCGDPYECAYFSAYSDYVPQEPTGDESLSVELR